MLPINKHNLIRATFYGSVGAFLYVADALSTQYPVQCKAAMIFVGGFALYMHIRPPESKP